MAKHRILLAALVILAVVFIAVSAVWIGSYTEQVTMDVQVLYGDISAARDLEATLELRTDNYRGNWLITCDPADTTTANTAFTYTYKEEVFDGIYVPYIELNVNIESFVDDYGRLSAYNPELAAFYKECLDSVAAGETGQFTFDLSEHCSHYPIEGEIGIAGYRAWFSMYPTLNGDDEINPNYFLLQELFPIPVLEGQTVQLNVERGESGDLYYCEILYPESGIFEMDIIGNGTAEAVYFTFNTHAPDGQVVDTSELPLGYGIYRLGYGYNKNGGVEYDLENIANICPLDPMDEVVYLYTMSDGTIHLTTQRDGIRSLNIIDPEAGCLLQRLELGPAEYQYERRYIGYPDGYLISYLPGTTLELYAENDDGTYSFCYSIPIAASDDPLYNLNNFGSYIYCKDGKLAVMSDRRYRYGDNRVCGFDLSIYDSTGLLYYGEYTTSLEQPTYAVYDRYRSRYGRIEISWK